MLRLLPVFRRYANVFGYARILRSISETWSNEPEWMISLRTHLLKLMNERQNIFGQTITI